MSIYSDWGFWSNPFQTTPLSPDDLGEKLLVGRQDHLAKLEQLLQHSPRHPTIEGLNGVGKTSLVNVASYRLYSRYMRTGNGALFIPCQRRFQLAEDTVPKELLRDIFFEIAHAVLKFKESFWAKGDELKHLKAIRKWLESPAIASFSAGISAFGYGVSGGGSSSSSPKGFDESGFRKLMIDWLSELFSDGDEGGVIVFLDNLELCRTTEKVKKTLELLRDELLVIPGIRCVLSGLPGIFLGPLGSPRIAGYLHNPILVQGVSGIQAGHILESRVEAFSNDQTEAYLPMTEYAFEELYLALNKNLRALLERADDYCLYAHGQPQSLRVSEKNENFVKWLREEGRRIFVACDHMLTPRCWDVFEQAVEMGGEFSPSDFSKFGFNAQENLREYVKQLEDAQLASSIRDDTDRRRKTILITPKGFLVGYYRDTLPKYQQPEFPV